MATKTTSSAKKNPPALSEAALLKQIHARPEVAAVRAGLMGGKNAMQVVMATVLELRQGRLKRGAQKMEALMAKTPNPSKDDRTDLRSLKSMINKNAAQIKQLQASPSAEALPLGAQAQLFLAAAAGDAKGLEAALSAGAKLNAVNLLKMTALGLAACKGREEAFDFLRSRGAKKLWSKDNAVRPALTCAAEEGNLTAVRLLLAAGVDPNTQSLSGESSLDWALSGKRSACAKLLRDAGAVSSKPEKLTAKAKPVAPVAARVKSAAKPKRR